MKRSKFMEDTIGRRLFVTVTLAAFVTLGLLQFFFMFGGTWAKPDIQSSGIPSQVGLVIRMVEAAPAADRALLAQSANMNKIRFAWHKAGTHMAEVLENGHYKTSQLVQSRIFLQPFLKHPPDKIVVFQEDNPISLEEELPYNRNDFHDAYFMAIRFKDGSWLLCIALERFWGLDPFQRFCLQMGILGIWIVAVTLIASRQLSRPIESLANGVRRLGLQPQSARLKEDGPRELRLVAQTINHMQEEIQKFIEYRTTMLAAISHDLRTPLTRIRLRGEFIHLPEEQKCLFRDVDEMQAMIDGALSFFRDDASGEDSIIFDLPGLLQTIAYDYYDQGYAVEYHGPTRISYTGRLYALKRVFSNLVENAIKYATPPLIDLEVNRDGDCIVYVRDDGPGLPEDELLRVFHPYYRLDRSRNRQTGGVGLGLTSAQTIIRAHGGEITMRNRPEGGLEVQVILPKMK